MGSSAQVDPLSEFFENVLDDHSLIDIPFAKLQPTWRNKRTGEDRLARRLDHFLIKERLLGMGYNYRQWVGLGGLLDQFPIYLKVIGGMNKPKARYKINSTWLKDAEYIKLVTNYWKFHPPVVSGNISKEFAHNLSELKRLSKSWAQQQIDG